MTEACWLTAAEASGLLARRALSPVELLQALLARIASFESRLNVFVTLDAEAAIAAARVAEREILAGDIRGPLHGIPIGIKDLIDVAGLPTTCHSKILLGNIATADAAVVARLRQAGAVILGKVATHEFAFGGPSFDLPFPPARNPWNLDHHPGGSSSGSGAGLAAGFFPLAIGTDTAGSIRHPAAACGITGLKPTYGRVSRQGVFPLAVSLDHVGPMARSVTDVAMLLESIAGHEPASPADRHGSRGDFTSTLGHGLRGLKIGFVRRFHQSDMTADPEVAAALEDVAAILVREGAVLRDVTLPELNLSAAITRTIMQSEAWSIHAPWLRTRPADYSQSSRVRLMTGAFLTAADYIDAQRRRTQVIAATEAVFREVDILLTANAMDPPCRIDDAEALARGHSRQARTPFNLTGHPALSLMAGLSRSGLPLSCQFVGRYWDEATVLRAGAAYERISGWSKRHPQIAA